jgi:hypothetical protein
VQGARQKLCFFSHYASDHRGHDEPFVAHR